MAGTECLCSLNNSPTTCEKDVIGSWDIAVCIALESAKYREAIQSNKESAEVKKIYLRIKKLQGQADLLMQRAQILRFGNEVVNDAGFMVQ